MNRFWLCLLAACSLPGCGPQVVAEPTEPANVLIVLIDTLRADRLGAYGSAEGLTPFLDRFAAGAYVFEHAYAQSSWTNPSVASLFTSRFQSEHGVVSYSDVVFTTGKIVRENPDLVRRYLRAVTRGMQYILDHQDETALRRFVDQRHRLLRRGRHRLLDQHVLARAQRRHRKIEVRGHRRGDRHGVD